MPDPVSHRFEIVNPVNIKNWNENILNLSNLSIFLTTNWARVLADSYRFQPKYITRFNNGTIEFLLPFMEIDTIMRGKKGVSLPFTDFCEPIQKSKSALTDSIDDIVTLAKKFGWKSVEVRGANQSFWQQKPMSTSYSHIINLADDHSLYSHLKSNVRRNIRKAQKEGLKIKIDDSLESLQGYYRLHCITRKRHGLPPQPIRFFTNIYDHIISKGFGKIVTAFRTNQAVASAIYLYFGDHAIYKFGASDVTFQHLRPNNLVMWEAIQFFARQGFKTLHLGKTEIKNEGLRRFKRNWGAEEQLINYYKYDIKKGCFVSQKAKENGWYNSVFNRIPLQLLRVIGSMVYRYAA